MANKLHHITNTTGPYGITYPLSAWLMVKELVDPVYLSVNLEEQESLANAKVNARQHCVRLSCLGDEDSEI